MFRKKTLIFAIITLLTFEISLFCQDPIVLSVPEPPSFQNERAGNERIENATITKPNSQGVTNVYAVNQTQTINDTRDPYRFHSLGNPSSTVTFYYSKPDPKANPPITKPTLLKIEASTYPDGFLMKDSFFGRFAENYHKTTWNFIPTKDGESQLATVTIVNKDNAIVYSWGKTSKKDGTFTFERHPDGPQQIQTVDSNGELRWVDVAAKGENAKVRISDKDEYRRLMYPLGRPEKYSLSNQVTIVKGVDDDYLKSIPRQQSNPNATIIVPDPVAKQPIPK